MYNISAALNAKIRNKSFIVFGNNNLSNKVTKASKINNYLGFYGVTGKDLAEKFKESEKYKMVQQEFWLVYI